MITIVHTDREPNGGDFNAKLLETATDGEREREI